MAGLYQAIIAFLFSSFALIKGTKGTEVVA
jgi:hypothetical protein